MSIKWLIFAILEVLFLAIIIDLTFIEHYNDALGFINLWLIVIYLTMRRKEAKDD